MNKCTLKNYDFEAISNNFYKQSLLPKFYIKLHTGEYVCKRVKCFFTKEKFLVEQNMNLIFMRKWWIQIYILLLPTVDLQFAVPVYPMAPIYALPPPMPIAIPVPRPPTTTTTTTTEKNNKGGDFIVAFPAPYPVPVPVYPGPPPPPKNICFKDHRPKGCPKCPPCLPPPPPLPPAPVYSVPAYVPVPFVRPPVVVVPYPPPKPSCDSPRSVQSTSCEEPSESTDGSSSEDSSSSRWRRPRIPWKPWTKRTRRGRKKIGHLKRYKHFRRSATKKEDLVRPVLTYVSEDGDIKIRKHLTKDDVDDLMGEDESDAPQKVQILAGDDGNKKLRIISQVEPKNKSPRHRKSQLMLRSGISQRNLKEGRKEMIFNPLGGKKITNLSVSFKIA